MALSPEERERLAALEEKIAAAREAMEGAPERKVGHVAQAGQAWRMVIDLVSGMGVGFALGYGIDYLAGTSPVFLVVFLLLGFAAGVRVMLQTAREVGKVMEEGAARRREEDGGSARRG